MWRPILRTTSLRPSRRRLASQELDRRLQAFDQLTRGGQFVDLVQQRHEFRAFARARLVERLRRCMQEFIGEAASKLIEHYLRRGSAGDQPARSLDFGCAQPFVVSI